MKNRIILFLLAMFIASLAYAQVTIGSPLQPNDGALLDLKENNNLKTNASHGLNLPRVNLTDIENLYPMFGDIDNINADYDTDSEKKDQDNLHIGLVVYNINTVKPHICPGVYIWFGTNWKRLPEDCPEEKTFNVELTGQSCGYTGRTLTYTSILTGNDTDAVVDRWTYAKEGNPEQIIQGEKLAVLNYEFPLGTTTEGNYNFTVYYKNNKGIEKSKTVTTQIHNSILSDFIIKDVNPTRRIYELSTTAHVRLAGHDFGTTINTPLVKWTYIKEGTTNEVLMNDTGSKTITYTFPSSGTYFYKMYWEFPCDKGLDPAPADFVETPRAVLNPIVVGKLIVR